MRSLHQDVRFAPGRLWSLWDIMQRILSFIEFQRVLWNREQEFGLRRRLPHTSPDRVLSDDDFFHLRDLIQVAVKHCSEHEMASAIDRLYIFRSRLIPGRTSVEDAHSELQGLTVALANEMHRTWFCYLPREKAQLQRDAPGEWSKVVAVFPTIQPEIESAHRCYSVGADTACVFHLMRAMETAVRKLSRRLRVTITPQTTWRQMTGSMDSKIKAMPEKTFRQKDKKNDWEEARANLHHVGSVWRNKTMHPAKSYTPSQAKEILQATRVFMISLCAL